MLNTCTCNAVKHSTLLPPYSRPQTKFSATGHPGITKNIKQGLMEEVNPEIGALTLFGKKKPNDDIIFLQLQT